GTVPGYAPVTAIIIDPQTLGADGALQTTVSGGGTARLVTYTKFFGNTTGGKSIESDEFEFPVDVCKGCLISFSATDINPNFGAPNCLGASGGGSSLPTPCFPGQDFLIDCAACQQIADCHPNEDAGIGGG